MALTLPVMIKPALCAECGDSMRHLMQHEVRPGVTPLHHACLLVRMRREWETGDNKRRAVIEQMVADMKRHRGG